MTKHISLLSCSMEAAAAWTNLFLASLFFFLYHITFPNSHAVSHVCHWHGRVDSCYMMARQMKPCLLAVLLLVTHIVFLKETKRTLRTKNFSTLEDCFFLIARIIRIKHFAVGDFLRTVLVEYHS